MSLQDDMLKDIRKNEAGQSVLMLVMVIVVLCWVLTTAYLTLWSYQDRTAKRQVATEHARDEFESAIELANQLIFSGVIRGWRMPANQAVTYWFGSPKSGMYWSMNPGFTVNSGRVPIAFLQVWLCGSDLLTISNLLVSYNILPRLTPACGQREIKVTFVDAQNNNFVELKTEFPTRPDRVLPLPNYRAWIRQRLGLGPHPAPNYAQNWCSINQNWPGEQQFQERWMIGRDIDGNGANDVFCILPNGQLRRWQGSCERTLGGNAVAEQVAEQALEFVLEIPPPSRSQDNPYLHPELLTTAQP